MFIFVLFSLIELSCFGLIKHNAMLLFKAMSNQHNFSKIITPFVQKRKTGCPVKKEILILF